jgi:hypothetical protein
VAGAEAIGAVKVYAGPGPQALLAVTDTDPATEPAVNVPVVVELVPLHPVPLTVHVYDVAPDTAGILYIAVALGHGAVGKVTLLGATGSGLLGALNIYGAPAPHELLAVTVTLAVPLPTTRVMLSTLLLPLHPVPFTDQV